MNCPPHLDANRRHPLVSAFLSILPRQCAGLLRLLCAGTATILKLLHTESVVCGESVYTTLSTTWVRSSALGVV